MKIEEYMVVEGRHWVKDQLGNWFLLTKSFPQVKMLRVSPGRNIEKWFRSDREKVTGVRVA